MLSFMGYKSAVGASVRFFSVSGVRSIAATPTLALPTKSKTASKKKAASPLAPLKLQLKKEKEKLTKLNAKLKAKEAKLKETSKVRAAEAKAKAAAKDKAAKTKKIQSEVVRKATRAVRGISPLNAYIKESAGASLTEKISGWKTLAADERSHWKDKADAFNSETEKVFKPKPKGVASGYQKFLSEEHGKDKFKELPFGDRSKKIAEAWRLLSAEAKKQYDAPAELQKKAKDDYDLWVKSRVDAYLKHKATKKEVAAFESK